MAYKYIISLTKLTNRSPVRGLPLPLAGFVSRLSRVQILDHALYIANWFASCQLGFLTLLCSFINYLFSLFQWHACKLAISLRYEAKCMTTINTYLFIFFIFFFNKAAS